MRLPISFLLAILAATAGCVFLSFATPAAAAPLSAATAPGASQSAVEHIGYRRWRRDRYYDRDTYVDAPFTYVERRRRHVAVDAPFVSVRTGRRGTWVRAPFVDLWSPR
jgi:hypothetical protein